MVEGMCEVGKIAIIGASVGQLPICRKAKEMGLETHCFAYDQDAVCKEVVDFFHPISVLEKDAIVTECRRLGIQGVVSNASDLTAEVVAYVSEKLGLTGAPYDNLLALRNKFHVRSLSSGIDGLTEIQYYIYNGEDKGLYPCVVKPVEGSSKKGVSFVSSRDDFAAAIQYADCGKDIVVEEYIDGKELSIESISYHGVHHIVQITDKDSSSAPHFAELGHHQPAQLPDEIRTRIYEVIPQVLNKIGYPNGPSHIEMKYNKGKLYLIEANLRGGGDNISNILVFLSSGVDYLRHMIEVAMGEFNGLKQVAKPAYSGIYYLCSQTAYILPLFESSKGKEWLVDCQIYNTELTESHSNYERDGYLIYKSNHKVLP